ncbi:MAG: ABC transporter ATP-binding protein [Deltaproteobacteria bacterium]|nr:ABC transporter ATP-binding protein [Deltaproteobacteria bacterium]
MADQEGGSFILIQGLTKRFGASQVLSAVDFSIFSGEVLGLIGPNGSGKTTLLECLCGLQPAQGGQVLCQGQSLPPEHRRGVMFFVPDGIVPYPEHTSEKVLTFFGGVYGRSRQDVREVVETLGLESMLTRPVGQLSKGWRRRLLLAIGLVTPHPLLVMDEPFDGFDLRQTRAVMSLLREVTAQGRTLLLSIHQLTDAERVCDRFVLLSAGKVTGEGTIEELRRQAGIKSSGLEEVFLALS